MLGGTTPASAKKRTGRFDPIGRRSDNFQQFGPGKSFVPFGQDNADHLSGRRERNKNNLPVMPGHPLAAIGHLGDGELDRPGAGRGRTFQYQLSLRSAGGTGSTCPVSCAGIFIDLVGMKKVPISMAPTPVSMITRDTPWAMPTV